MSNITREEAITMLKSKMDGSVDTSYEWAETVRMAIEALKTDIVYCYECKYNGNCCQCVDIIDDILSLNFCGRGERSEMRCEE